MDLWREFLQQWQSVWDITSAMEVLDPCTCADDNVNVKCTWNARSNSLGGLGLGLVRFELKSCTGSKHWVEITTVLGVYMVIILHTSTRVLCNYHPLSLVLPACQFMYCWYKPKDKIEGTWLLCYLSHQPSASFTLHSSTPGTYKLQRTTCSVNLDQPALIPCAYDQDLTVTFPMINS